MYRAYIYCKEKLSREKADPKKIYIYFPHSSHCLGLEMICPWRGPQALRVEIHSLKLSA